MVVLDSSSMTALKYPAKAYIGFTVAGEGQEAMNCQIHALSLLLFAIVCNDDIAEEKKT